MEQHELFAPSPLTENERIVVEAVRRDRIGNDVRRVISTERVFAPTPTIVAEIIDQDGRKRRCAVYQWARSLTVIQEGAPKRTIDLPDGWAVHWA